MSRKLESSTQAPLINSAQTTDMANRNASFATERAESAVSNFNNVNDNVDDKLTADFTKTQSIIEVEKPTIPEEVPKPQIEQVAQIA